MGHAMFDAGTAAPPLGGHPFAKRIAADFSYLNS